MEAPHSPPASVSEATVDSAGGGDDDGVNHGDPCSLYVGDLDLSVTDSELYDYFTNVCPVVSARVCRYAATKTSLGYGYVNYNNRDDAEKALNKLNYTDLNGKVIRIDWKSEASPDGPSPREEFDDVLKLLDRMFERFHLGRRKHHELNGHKIGKDEP